MPEGNYLIPESLSLLANVTLGGNKHPNNRVVENFGWAVVCRHTFKVNETIIEDLNRPDLVEALADLWRPKEGCANMVEQGLQDVEVNKHRSGVGDKNSTAADIAVASAFPKYKIPLSIGTGSLKLFQNQGTLPTSELPQLRIELVLA